MESSWSRIPESEARPTTTPVSGFEEGFPTKRAFSAFLKAFEKGILIRTTGDIIALSPPLIIEKSHIDQLFGTLREVLKEID